MKFSFGRKRDLTSAFSRPVTHLVPEGKVHPNGRSIQIENITIDYRDISQAVINEDTVSGNGVGGSVYLRTIPSHGNPGREVKVFNFTLDDKAFKLTSDALITVEAQGASVMRRKGPDDVFRDLFFFQG
ncbi:hypothetical protein ASC89_00315 [Devosia sp. Root413D1]|uniref:hypothetical protein n=1 Tax=Devosia sp. Root413D1 TaxID=1736531 RepID=UPI0006FEDFE3|nr:hypothetical protein [Devosia sp. Root413D1]KQW85568.1 hypothetical protein ASC89_00315 [Devosia sp. Root413D1]